MKKLLLSLCCILLLCSCQESTEHVIEEANTLSQSYEGFTYYRELLSGEEKDMYDLFYYHISNHDTSFRVTAKDEDTFLSVIDHVIKDHPELFWYDRSDISYTEYSHGKTHSYEVMVEEHDPIETTKQLEEQIKSVTAPVIEQIKAQPNDYEKVKYAYDYIIDQTQYQEGSADNQNIISVFLNRVSVCAGYAKGLQYLLNASGIPCAYMTGGTKYSADNHAWNLIRLNGEYYYLDPTNGDYSNEDIDQRVRYAYFAMDTQGMLSLFTPDTTYELTTAKTLNYFYQTDSYFTTVDMEKLQMLLTQSVVDQSNSIAFQCSTKQVCTSINQTLERHETLFHMIDTAGYHAKEYRNVEIPETNVWVYEYE